MIERRLVASHVLWPAIAFIAMAVLFALTDLDRTLAHAWAFDAELQKFPARDRWWANELAHTGGRNVVWCFGLAAIAAWIASFCAAGWRGWRRPALFVFLAIGLSTLIVAILKELTNVDCPWDLSEFGGRFPYVRLFADRPDDLPRAACFPGAHASSGFALMALYFASRERNHRFATAALLFALAVGSIFAFGQEARGAHFLSHDLWSAFIVWFVELALYAFAFGGRLWPPE
ncbi:MAG TPA: phosphatase PAP2 family protein [Steroidobacteraceae bacterium]|nr:phosphatase PAP2 family protein [Steroidobacteraceae bacterium]